jgi:diguanylate cyclase (GGDEF)-like protein
VSLKTILVLAMPGAMVLLIAFGALKFAPSEPLLAQATRGFPYITLAAAALLAWRLNASRLFIAAVVVAIAHRAMPPGLAGGAPVAAALMTTILPLIFALLVFAPDVRITSVRALRQYALGFGLIVVTGVLTALTPAATFRLLTYPWIDPVYTDWSSLPQPTLLAVTLALITLAVIVWRSHAAPAAGLLWTTLATAFAFASPADSIARGTWVLAAGIVLLIALVEYSYFIAYHDELTRLPGRRALAQMLGSLTAPYAIAVIDVDHFKKFNDLHGHDVGDEVLRMVAGKLGAVTGGGIPFRSGGEEFVIVFPRSQKKEAAPHLDALCAAVAETEFTVRKKPRPRGKQAVAKRGTVKKPKPGLTVTISIGVASPGRTDTGVDVVLKSADKAMYRAKRDGRNRVVA